MSKSWIPGIVYMETVEDGNSSLSMHRCWNVERFKAVRRAEAIKRTESGKPSAVRFLDAADYRKAGGR